MAQLRAASSNVGEIYQAFPLGGPCRTLDVGDTWQDLLGASTVDLIMIRVPAETRRAIVIASDDDLSGQAVTPTQALASWILDPGFHPFCVDRDLGADEGPKIFVALDPDDASSTATTSAIRVLEGAR